MRLYFLLEGRRTEKKLYGAWLPNLLAGYSRLDRVDHNKDNSYFLFSACGYPAILQSSLENAIRDVNQNNFNRLILVLDCDEYTIEARRLEVEEALAKMPIRLDNAGVDIVLQNRTVETWLLGNRKIISRSPQSAEFRDALRFYDVTQNDPERMPKPSIYNTHAQWHWHYLTHAFKHKHLNYSKFDPGHACESCYLDELVNRGKDGHICTFQQFVQLCYKYSANLSISY